MSFWGSLFGGQNPSLSSDINQSAANASFANTTGTKDVSTASNFMGKLLSGDSSQVSTLLAPQISGIQNRAQQARQQIGEFGGRTGGNTAAMNKSYDDVHSQVNDLIAHLTGSAVSSIGSLGMSLLGQGSSDLSQNAGFSQQQMENYKNSILGKGLSTLAQGAEVFGMGAMGGGLPNGVGAIKGGQSALGKFLSFGSPDPPVPDWPHP